MSEKMTRTVLRHLVEQLASKHQRSQNIGVLEIVFQTFAAPLPGVQEFPPGTGLQFYELRGFAALGLSRHNHASANGRTRSRY